MRKQFFRHITAILLFAGVILAISNVFAASSNLTYFKSLDSIRKVMELIKSDYVEDKVDEEQLLYGAIEGMLKKLDDPFTRFMDPKTFQEMQTDTQGEFGGIGILITKKGTFLTVISPLDGTPAAKAGVMAGDKIVKIDGKDVIDIQLDDALKLLRGPVNTKVVITVARDGVKKTFDFELERKIIKVASVKYWLIEPDIGYIRLTQFIQTSSEDIEKALIALEKHGVKSIILDLRNNPGGLLSSAVEVSRKFLPKGDIVSIRGRDSEPSTYSSFFKSHPLLPLIVLINEGSASAAEIVAGAIKDNKRGLLLGKKTFGKGSVQTVIALDDGSAIALTTALYYTPSGVNIHKSGIEPDVEVDLPKYDESKQESYKEAIEKDQAYLQMLKNASITNTETPASYTAELSDGKILINYKDGKTASETYKLSGFVEVPDGLVTGKIENYVANPLDEQLKSAVNLLRSVKVFMPVLAQEQK
ncbi:MAG: S41 family peptidase [Candidatus Riflebacteria bacterium]|nr:S41 family peptidase [Candidatus Riflebacteria bacterium]